MVFMPRWLKVVVDKLVRLIPRAPKVPRRGVDAPVAVGVVHGEAEESLDGVRAPAASGDPKRCLGDSAGARCVGNEGRRWLLSRLVLLCGCSLDTLRSRWRDQGGVDKVLRLLEWNERRERVRVRGRGADSNNV